MSEDNKSKKVPYPVGLRITNVRLMTKDEAEVEGWDWGYDSCYVLELSDGGKIYPSQDPEGNGPGFMFGCLKDGQSIYVTGIDDIEKQS